MSKHYHVSRHEEDTWTYAPETVIGVGVAPSYPEALELSDTDRRSCECPPHVLRYWDHRSCTSEVCSATVVSTARENGSKS